MGSNCCNVAPAQGNEKIRKALWQALTLNFIMFLVEFASSFSADSVSLKADSIDFLGDSFNYGIGLFVLNAASNRRSYAAIFKGTCMGIFGIWVIIEAITNAYKGSLPNAEIMGGLGFLALAVNVYVAYMLYKHRNGDSNLQSIWLCSRNDAIGNIAVILAASGVFLSKSMWPDLLVALIIGFLGFTSSYKILRTAKKELAANKANLHEK